MPSLQQRYGLRGSSGAAGFLLPISARRRWRRGGDEEKGEDGKRTELTEREEQMIGGT